MDIKIISVSAMSEGAEILLTLSLCDGEGHTEKRKLLLFTEQYLELGLKRGSLLDEELFEKLEQLAKQCKAIKKGSDLLSYSASSERRLAMRLRNKGFDKDSANFAASHLKSMGVINEELDVERAVSVCLKKLWGKKRIYRELCFKGYESDIISRELSSVDGEKWIDNCRALYKKKFCKGATTPDEQKKIIASLVRYGYSFSEIKIALQNE